MNPVNDANLCLGGIAELERGGAEEAGTERFEEREEQFELFTREGVFYARLIHPLAGERMEIALHGVSSTEEAMAAVEVLSEGMAERS